MLTAIKNLLFGGAMRLAGRGQRPVRQSGSKSKSASRSDDVLPSLSSDWGKSMLALQPSLLTAVIPAEAEALYNSEAGQSTLP
jgi:hypothetical protein